LRRTPVRRVVDKYDEFAFGHACLLEGIFYHFPLGNNRVVTGPSELG
jgi:hypothetical protein